MDRIKEEELISTHSSQVEAVTVEKSRQWDLKALGHINHGQEAGSHEH